MESKVRAIPPSKIQMEIHCSDGYTSSDYQNLVYLLNKFKPPSQS